MGLGKIFQGVALLFVPELILDARAREINRRIGLVRREIESWERGATSNGALIESEGRRILREISGIGKDVEVYRGDYVRYLGGRFQKLSEEYSEAYGFMRSG